MNLFLGKPREARRLVTSSPPTHSPDLRARRRSLKAKRHLPKTGLLYNGKDCQHHCKPENPLGQSIRHLLLLCCGVI